MGLIKWFRRTEATEDRRVREWRAACVHAASQPDPARLDVLRHELDSWGLDAEDMEIEREMLEGLNGVVELARTVQADGLPLVQTGHRVVGTDTCHFSAPCSMPDEEGQPGGRLLLTGRRAIFVGGARGMTIPFHAIGRVAHDGRDLVLVRSDRPQLHRFRCNSFADSFRAAFVARTLVAAPGRGAGL
jgi:hypothetical protein